MKKRYWDASYMSESTLKAINDNTNTWILKELEKAWYIAITDKENAAVRIGELYMQHVNEYCEDGEEQCQN